MTSLGNMVAVVLAAFGLAVGASAQSDTWSLQLQVKDAAHANLLAARAEAAPLAWQEAVVLPPAGELQLTNTGELRPVIFEGHQLTTGATEGVAAKILYCPSEADDAAYRAAISAAAGGATVDYLDTRITTPSVATLLQYDAVYTWVNFDYLDPVGFGNNLASYNDQGGNVVLGAFCTFTTGNFLSGTIMTAAYCPVDSPFGTNHFVSSNYKGDGTTCIYTGVVSLACQFRDFLVTQGSGVVDGTYLDNEICHAYRGASGAGQGEVVYSNGSGAIQLAGTGQWGAAAANSALCPLSLPDAWTDQGSALAGTFGDPELVGSGPLSAGSQNVLDLDNALPLAAACLFYSSTSSPAAFKGGVLLPGPTVNAICTAVDAGGDIVFRWIQPAGVPAGTTAWLQWAIADGGAVHGVALSNAVRGVTP